jgi:hypothetical protein
MSEPQNNEEPRTTILHLNKFVPKGPLEPPTSTTDEGQTVMIRKAAAETVAQSAQPVTVPKGGQALPPKEMLGAVAYCYSKGVYRSEDIERKMNQDQELRGALHGEVPDAHSIRRFRRFNRDAIRTVLEKFFRRTRRKAAAAPGAPAPESTPTTAANDNTQFLDKKAAHDQLDKAAWIDNMSKDD